MTSSSNGMCLDVRIFLLGRAFGPIRDPRILDWRSPEDYGYDPFGLDKKPKNFEKLLFRCGYQAFELIHVGWAMLRAVASLSPKPSTNLGPTVALKLVRFKGFEDKLHLSGPFDPLGLAKDPDQARTPEGPVENPAKHLGDPFDNNLLIVIVGSVERTPSL
ncbi:unnamed protein product [Dovyalis caffra]|uniref:Chlorophyll a-b binding protein, chloroplastic n=1 Tax=Dovyalis caffra TaxID=77055 RepID=A0AAV1S3B7_9ROSI|nr:unnamed protein product [Dovyalis caffra]